MVGGERGLLCDGRCAFCPSSIVPRLINGQLRGRDVERLLPGEVEIFPGIVGGVFVGVNCGAHKHGGFQGFTVGGRERKRQGCVSVLLLLRRAFLRQYARLHGGRVVRLVYGRGGVLHPAWSPVAVGVVTEMRAERRGRRGSAQVCGRPVRVQGRGLGGHGVHVVQAGVRALLLRSQAQPLGLGLQLLAHRAAMVKRGLGPLLLLLGLLQLFPQLVFGDRLGKLARGWRVS